MPLIKRDFIESLNDKVDIISTISKRIELIHKGKDYKACCPFHQEKTPSFNVSPQKGLYHCFGCGASGTALKFVQEFDNLDFVSAVERLCEENNIEIEYETNAKPVDNSIIRLKELNSKVANFFAHQLRTHPLKQQVVDYAKNRGISGEIAKRFNLGFAPPGWDNLYKYFGTNTTDIKDLEKLGLIVKKDNGQYYDRFRNRLMFPIVNIKNQVIGFGGRVLKSDDKPKYLNSSQSAIFDKSSELYGLSHAQKYTKKIEYLLVVEGYMDVVGLHNSGITSCVATLGTATTQQHIKILARNTHNIIFCFDGDSAGFNAGIKALKIVLPLINAEMSIKFLFLPDGEDPDSLIKKEGKNKFEKRILGATHLSDFLFSHLKQEDFNSIEGKTKFIQNAKKLIFLVKYNIYKEQLIQGLADEVGQSVESIEKIVHQQEKQPIKQKITHKQNNADIRINFKAQMTKIITMVLKHPALGTDELMTKIKKIPNTEVLQKIIDMTAFEDGKNTYNIIETFKGNTKIYNRLWSLVNNSPKLTEVDCEKELQNALNIIQELQIENESRTNIPNFKNATTQELEEYQKNIRQRKVKASIIK